jgi:site-specific recombinase XerD
MLPLFDNINYLSTNARNVVLPDHASSEDFTYALSFLRCYTESIGTFNSYRREVERLLQWCAHKKICLTDINRDDIEQFIRFCQHPPKSWIGLKKVARFVAKAGVRLPNPEWKPFVVTVPKSQLYAMKIEGLNPCIEDYKMSQGSLQETFAILSTFFNFLISERYLVSNPLELIRQKSKYFRKQQHSAQLRRISSLQWQTILNSVSKIEGKTDIWKERTLFILSLLFGLYLRISEVTASERWSPVMSHFSKDSEGNWWFTTVGKGNKERQIAVSEAVLASLIRWRLYLKLNPLPTPADNRPLIPKLRDYGPMTNTRAVRRILQLCFDKAADILAVAHPDESDGMREVTVHWLRHTAISEDVKRRPINHVRDDAGHESITTTNRYVNTLHCERHQSAKHKPLK